MSDPNPYRSPNSIVADEPDGNLAGRGIRLGAALLDGLILLVIFMPMMYFGGYFSEVTAAAQAGGRVAFGTQLMWAAAGFLVFVLVQAYPLNATGQTWGKKATKIKIVDLAGNKPALGKLLGVRYLPLQLISNVPVIGPMVALVDTLMIFRGDRRCGHDLIAGTRVVNAD